MSWKALILFILILIVFILLLLFIIIIMHGSCSSNEADRSIGMDA